MMAAVAAMAACRQPDGPSTKSGNDRVQEPDVAYVAGIAGLHSPESARYDPDQDAWFISNIGGFGSEKDGRGYIARVPAGQLDSVAMFAISGRNGVELDAPKGIAIQGDTLWVADIDVLRGFDRRTGAPVGTIDFSAFRPTLLNDVALAPDGSLRVTDSGILMTEKGVLRPGGDKIFSVSAGRRVNVVQSGPQLGEPNGIAWDSTGNRLVVAGFKRFNARVDAYPSNFASATGISTSGGQLDGVEVLPGGALIYSCWTDSSIHVIENGEDRRLIRFVPEPADIGYDTKRGIVAIPLVMMNQVAFFSLPARLTRVTQSR